MAKGNGKANGEHAPAPEAQTIEQAAEESTAQKLMTCMIQRFREQKRPWAAMTEAEQRSELMSVEMAVRDAVTKAVRAIAADNRAVIMARLEKITVKDEIQAVCVLNKTDERRHELMDATGLAVMIIVADAEAHVAGTDKIEPDVKDQPGMPLGDPKDPSVFDNTAAGRA